MKLVQAQTTGPLTPLIGKTFATCRRLRYNFSDSNDIISAQSASPPVEFNTTLSLEGLQSDEQRRVLNIVDQLRKSGLESILSLPQLVVW